LGKDVDLKFVVHDTLCRQVSSENQRKYIKWEYVLLLNTNKLYLKFLILFLKIDSLDLIL